MKWTSILAIYSLFWVMSIFFVLPFGVRTHGEAGIDLVPGQADSAPTHFDVRRILIRMTIVSAVAFALYYANYVGGWIGAEDFDLLGMVERHFTS